jgi:hypothetical protein
MPHIVSRCLTLLLDLHDTYWKLWNKRFALLEESVAAFAIPRWQCHGLRFELGRTTASVIVFDRCWRQ